jgi:hypothetical protein
VKKKRRSLEDNECFGSAHHPVALVVAVAQEPHSQSKTLPQEEEEDEEEKVEEATAAAVVVLQPKYADAQARIAELELQAKPEDGSAAKQQPPTAPASSRCAHLGYNWKNPCNSFSGDL